MAEYVPESDKRARVETVIRQLGLQGVANSRIGGDGRHRGLSGGERRWVSIALEIVAGVEVLILDEPVGKRFVHLRTDGLYEVFRPVVWTRFRLARLHKF
jgi:ABC-type nitrate/sulfonate/bicarbonate transport system ATPase subunit